MSKNRVAFFMAPSLIWSFVVHVNCLRLIVEFLFDDFVAV